MIVEHAWSLRSPTKNVLHRILTKKNLGPLLGLSPRPLPLCPTLRTGPAGPFRVIQVESYGAVEVEDISTGRTFKVNGKRLKPYVGGNILRNVSSITLFEV